RRRSADSRCRRRVRLMIIRKEKHSDKFTILANSVIQNETLSFAARGLLAYLLSKPNDWHVKSTHLKKQMRGRGFAKVRTELKKHGYWIQQSRRGKHGKWSGSIVLIREIPDGGGS